jgi:hypothetical protein
VHSRVTAAEALRLRDEEGLCPDDLPDTYPYLLGLYLGGGCISEHRRAVARIDGFVGPKR